MKLSEIDGMTYSEIVRTAEGKMTASELIALAQLEDAKLQLKLNNELAEAYRTQFEKSAEHHAKQQYADFVKAAMQAILTDPIWVNNIEGLAVSACDAAEATLEEMTRRGK